MTTFTTASGRTREIPANFHNPENIAGLDPEGRIVVDNFNARTADPIVIQGRWTIQPSMFGLTLCCDASDKGTEDGIVCRKCYGEKPNADTGDYITRAKDGSFPGLDPIV